MSYGIMRVEKRGRGAVYGLQIENEREEEDKDKRTFDASEIDWDRTSQNEHLIQSKQWSKDITERIKKAGCKEKKSSIVMLDGFYGASPEWFKSHTKEEAQQYFKDCLDYHVKTYCQGNRDLVINAVVHWDEATPHLHCESVPLMQKADGWHLTAKDIMGGRMDYRHRQDSFYEQVSRQYGLERGEVAEYQTVRGKDGEWHTKRPEDMKEHLAVLEYKNTKEEEKTERIRQEQLEAIKDKNSVLRDVAKAKGELKKVKAETQTARQLVAKAEEAEPLVRMLDKAPRSLEIPAKEKKNPLTGREIVTLDKKDYQTLVNRAALGEGLQKSLRVAKDREKKARKDAEKAAEDRQKAEEAERRTADLTPEKERQKRAARAAESYQRQLEDWIVGTAKNIVKKTKDEPEKDTYTERLEKFTSHFYDNGKNLLETFQENEKAREKAEIKAREQRIREQAERAARRKRDEWEYER